MADGSDRHLVFYYILFYLVRLNNSQPPFPQFHDLKHKKRAQKTCCAKAESRAVTSHYPSEQLLLFVFARQKGSSVQTMIKLLLSLTVDQPTPLQTPEGVFTARYKRR